MLDLAEHAETYLQQEHRKNALDAERGDSVADRHYDAAGSAREFRERNDFDFE